MAQIRVKDLTFCYDGGIDNIFENASFSIDTDWRLGFIGRNGKGKTTFLNLLLGKYQYRGVIDAPSGFRYFPYQVTERQMGMEAWEFLDELEAGCELWQAARELADLGETDEILYRPFGSLSPGERTKILLAVMFAGDGGFFLIDEPTNHLDREARETVQTYLALKKGFILVSHDRDLLDACTDHCLVLNRKTIEVVSGNFSVWWENKTRRDQAAVSENEKHLREIRKLKEASARAAGWADKNESTKIGFDPVKVHDRFIGTRSYIGAKTKKMQSRVKQMEKRIGREILEKEGLLKDLEAPADLRLTILSHHKSVLVEARDYGIRYKPAGQPVFEGLDLSVEKGERVALAGRNGCGKSTLLRSVLGKSRQESLLPDVEETGVCRTAAGLVISYVGQEARELKGSLRELCRERELDESLFLAVLRQLDFERTQFLKNMEDYSEGQKKKVLLAASLVTPAHLYIWDEPLNYIDIFSRIQIEKLLLEYQPAMLFVEHDADFCRRIATKTVRFGGPARGISDGGHFIY